MATATLPTTTNSGGSQTSTSSGLQAPQNANSVSGGTPSSIQPVISGSLLDTKTGIPLSNNQLSTVALAPTSGQTATVAQPKPHHINPGLLAFSIALFVFAIALFYFTGRAEKNTTKNR